MRGQNLSIAPLGGLSTTQPQPPETASTLTNWTIDPEYGGWSTRIGYERYGTDYTAAYAPFTSLGRIDMLAIFGAPTRYTILFESAGTLYCLRETCGGLALATIRSGRVVTPPAGLPPQAVEVPGGVVVLNGADHPLYVRADQAIWGGTSTVTAGYTGVSERVLGFSTAPPAPRPFEQKTVNATDPPSSPDTAANGLAPGESAIFWPTQDRAFSKPAAKGLGFSAAEKVSEYMYRVSWVLETGAESPLSTYSERVKWEIRASENGFRYCPVIEIPVGPPGTVARRIYRTANISPDSNTIDDPTTYLIWEVRNNVETHWVDSYPISSVLAPPEGASVVVPAVRARVGATWGGRLWLDGGVEAPTRLYYSAKGLFEQFEVDGYQDLPAGGGAVVGLVAHYGMLLLLRESGIDAIAESPDGSTRVVTLSTRVHCRSPLAVATPDGTLVLARDGVWLVSGGIDGGAVIGAQPLSASIQQIINRTSPTLYTRAVGVYDPIRREAHIYVPADGSDRPTLGLVWHTDLKTWSTREGFPVGCAALHPSGNIVFGHTEGTDAGTGKPAGLFVISGRRTLGATDSVEQGAVADNVAPTSIYQSAWHHWGDFAAKKKVLYLTLLVPAMGDQEITVQWAKDQKLSWTDAPTYKLQPADSEDLAAYGDSLLPTATTEAAGVYDTATWQFRGLIPVRYAVSIESCSTFSWRLVTTEDIILLGYTLTWDSSGTQVIEGKTR